MKKFVSAVIYSLILTLISVTVIFLLQAPLVSFVYYGFLSKTNSITFNTNVINKVADKETITIIVMIIQIILTFAFVFSAYIFISKIINIFLKDEEYIRPYYLWFFFFTLIIPIILIFFSIFLKIKLFILGLVVEGIFSALTVLLIIFRKKILPDTTNYEYRKYLFTEGTQDE